MKAEQKHYDAAYRAIPVMSEADDCYAAVDAALALIPEPVTVDEALAEKLVRFFCYNCEPPAACIADMLSALRAALGESVTVAPLTPTEQERDAAIARAEAAGEEGT